MSRLARGFRHVNLARAGLPLVVETTDLPLYSETRIRALKEASCFQLLLHTLSVPSHGISLKQRPEWTLKMTDVSHCGAGILFCGHRRRFAQVAGWWNQAKPHSPSTTVDATKIRLVCLYLSLGPHLGFSTDSFNGLPGIETLDPFLQASRPEVLSLPRRSQGQKFQHMNQQFNSRQFWWNFDASDRVSLAEVNFEICKHFSRIPFHHWIQAALGHRSEVVDDLLTSVTMIRHKYRRHWEASGRGSRTRSLPNLKLLHPLTHGLFNDLPDSLLSIERLEFILEPIRSVLRTSPTTHLSQYLIILGLRFEVTYIRPALVDWSVRLSTDFELVKDLAYDGPKALAREMTERDIETFKNITMDELKRGSDAPTDLRWHQISRKIEETVVSCPVLCKLVSELAKNLYLLRNYFSMTAVLAGIHTAAVHFPTALTCLHELSDLSLFLQEDNNYAYCRINTIRDRGLPWLSPFRMACRESRTSIRSSDDVISMANLMIQIMTYGRVHAKHMQTVF